MSISSPPSLPSFTTFGDLLHYLRRRARLTQRELSIAVGYSESMISRLEHNERPPDVATLLAVFVSALQVAGEPEVVAQLTALARAARGEIPAVSKQIESPAVGNLQHTQSASYHLPRRLTSFIGRAVELVAVTRLLTQARLVTLTGPGGCGKTSLAIEIARTMADTPHSGHSSGPGTLHFKDGIYLVEFLPLTDPAFMAQSILLALGGEGNPEWPALATLRSFLGNKEMLLVLDNCEHLIDAAAHTSETLLRTCPHLRILVTSRERLNIPGEILFTVSSLAFPNPQILPTLAALPHFGAIQLFVERGQAVVPNFTLTIQNVATVAQICARLDGIPLALELAAAALLTFSVQEIAKRLDAHFLLSTPGYRTADARHQSLNEAVAWSYNLLAPAEQRLLARLAIFVGGWNAEALQTICQDETESLALLRQLVQKSLVRVEQSELSAEGHTRYHLLRAIREYAAARLGEQEEAEIIRHHHFAYFAQFATERGADVLGPDHQQAMADLDADYHNIRAAFFYADGKAELADMRMRLAAALPYYWKIRGYVAEGFAWLQAALANEHLLALATRARVYAVLLNENNHFHWNIDISDLAKSARWLAVAETLIEPTLAQGDQLAAAQLMLAVGSSYEYYGQLPKAAAYAKRAQQIFQTVGDLRGMSFAHNLLIWVTFKQGDLQAAQTLQEEHIRSRQQSGASWSLCEAYVMQVEFARNMADRRRGLHSLKQLVALAEQEDRTWFLNNAYVDFEKFDPLGAIAMAEALLDRQRQQGPSVMLGVALYQLGRMVLNRQQFERAQGLLDEALALWPRLNERPELSMLPWSLIVRGQVAYFRGDLEKALACFGESIERFATSIYSFHAARPFTFRGYVRLSQNDLDGAVDDFCQCLQEVPKGLFNMKWLLNRALAGIGEAAHRRGNLALAALLLATVSSVEAKKLEEATPALFYEVADFNRIMARVPAYQQDPVFAAAWQEGERLSVNKAIALALRL